MVFWPDAGLTETPDAAGFAGPGGPWCVRRRREHATANALDTPCCIRGARRETAGRITEGSAENALPRPSGVLMRTTLLALPLALALAAPAFAGDADITGRVPSPRHGARR